MPKIIKTYTIIAHDKKNPSLSLSYPEYANIDTPLSIYRDLKNSYDCKIIQKTSVIYESVIRA